MVKINITAWRSYLPIGLATSLVGALCFAQLTFFIKEEAGLRSQQRAAKELKKILVVAYGLWEESGELGPEKLWRHLGRRTALLDPWGSPYQILATTTELRCSSFGPDRLAGTADDIVQFLPRSLGNAASPQGDFSTESPVLTKDSPKSIGHGAQ